MSFRYYMIFDRKEPERPQGLFTFNEGEGRFAFVGWSHLNGRWMAKPSFINYVYGEESDDAIVVSRSRAEGIAKQLGIPIPSQEELIEIADARERERQRSQQEPT